MKNFVFSIISSLSCFSVLTATNITSQPPADVNELLIEAIKVIVSIVGGIVSALLLKFIDNKKQKKQITPEIKKDTIR